VHRLAAAGVQTPFDLATGPLVPTSLYRLAPDDARSCSSPSITPPATSVRAGAARRWSAAWRSSLSHDQDGVKRVWFRPDEMALGKLKRALEEVEITVTGRRSGRDRSVLVWFVQEDDKLYLLPLKGSDTEWCRNVKTPAIRLAAGGAEATATATPLADPAKVSEVVEKFRVKHGDDVGRYYEKFDAAVEVPLA
jgi:hypothetical protein